MIFQERVEGYSPTVDCRSTDCPNPGRGLTSAIDPTVLEWAAQAGRVLPTHDVTTITSHAYERLHLGQRMAGVFQVNQTLSVAQVIDQLLLIVECSLEGEWERQIPLPPLAVTALLSRIE